VLTPDTPIADDVRLGGSHPIVNLSLHDAWTSARGATVRVLLAAILLVGAGARLSVVRWDSPATPHHPDETVLPMEATALWEGISPREVGWPASTTRLLMSATFAVQWAADRSAHTHGWRDPLGMLDDMAAWIGARYVDSAPLFRSARALMIGIGMLQLIVLMWALRQWTGLIGTSVGALGAAIAPLAVSHSQYLLADMTGVLFATIIVGLAGRPLTTQRVLAMSVLAALAAASKFHFGIWLLVPLCAVWVSPAPTATKARQTVLTVGLFACTLTALVPWFWLNPVLAIKELAGVILIKVVTPTRRAFALPFVNTWRILQGLGGVTLVGALLGLAVFLRHPERRLAGIVLPVALGTVALAASAIVFDRYGLVLLPGLSLLAGMGWQAAWSARGRTARAAALAAVILTTIATSSALLESQRVAGEHDVSLLASDWILAHVRPGARVARHDEDNTFLPRTREQLDACAAGVYGADAYLTKLRVVGSSDQASPDEPMRSAVLNDELFQAYWCRRERTARLTTGFAVTTYHAEPRYGSLLERDAIAEFRAGIAGSNAGLDVLVMNRPVDVGVPPAALLRTSRGERVIYARPGALL
jgi:hypothetical protein